MMAGKRWCESRRMNRPTWSAPGGRVARVITDSLTVNVAPGSSASTWKESPATVTRRWRGFTPASPSLTSLAESLPTVSEGRSPKSRRETVAK